MIGSTEQSAAFQTAQKVISKISIWRSEIRPDKEPSIINRFSLRLIRLKMISLQSAVNRDTLARMSPQERTQIAAAINAERAALVTLGISTHSSALINLEVLILGRPGEPPPEFLSVSAPKENFLSRLVRRLQKHKEETAQAELPKEPSDPLRSLDIPRRKFGITGDTLNPQNVPKNFQKIVQAMRACGRRRTGDEEQDPSIKLKHEAKFLGITETEYKAILLASGQKDPGGWKEEIQNESRIRDLLQQLNDHFDEAQVPQLLELLKNHPPLVKPKYYAQLFTLLQKVSTQEQKEQIRTLLRSTIDGLNSRKLAQFRHEVRSLLPEISEQRIFEPSYTQTGAASIVPQEEQRVEDRHGTIIQFIEEDLAVLGKLEHNEITLEKAYETMKSRHAAVLLTPNKGEEMPLPDRIALAKKKLEEAKQLQQTWKAHPEKALRYFHATGRGSYEEILKGKIAVAGGGGPAGAPSYSGAFVSRYPLRSYGTIAFGFGEDIEYHARAVKTSYFSEFDIWLGFDRAVVPDPETGRQGDLYRKEFRDQILSHPAVQKLSQAQRSLLEIGLARLLENDLDIQRVGPNQWEAVLTLPTGDKVKGTAILQSLLTNNPFTPPIQKAYQTALKQVQQSRGDSFGTIQPSESHPQISGLVSTEPQDAHMRALIVFDDESLLQERNRQIEKDYVLRVREFPSKDEVRKKCEDLGITVNGEPVPLIQWTVAEICSDYDVLFGLGQFGTKPRQRAKSPISPTREFF
jgi:hypothetical protein